MLFPAAASKVTVRPFFALLLIVPPLPSKVTVYLFGVAFAVSVTSCAGMENLCCLADSAKVPVQPLHV